MKLYFLRHGLADRSAWDGDDFHRPLTPRGVERMQRQAKFIRNLNLNLDAILTSRLTRAAQTAEIVADGLDMLDLLEEEPRLEYGFGRQALSEIIDGHPEADSLMLVGHEPSFSATIESVIGGGSVVCKKGSLARVDLSDAGPLAGELIWLIPPKAMV